MCSPKCCGQGDLIAKRIVFHVKKALELKLLILCIRIFTVKPVCLNHFPNLAAAEIRNYQQKHFRYHPSPCQGVNCARVERFQMKCASCAKLVAKLISSITIAYECTKLVQDHFKLG